MAKKRNKKFVINNTPDFLNELWNQEENYFLFRGQPKNWPLLPSIARRGHLVEKYENWRVFQDTLLDHFTKFAHIHFNDRPADKLEWLIHAQHFGIPTCLLDFSTSPLKALFFAVFGSEYDDQDGVLWSVAPSQYFEDFSENRKFTFDGLDFYLPRQINHRLIAQQGCFAAFPMPQNFSKISPLDEPGAYTNSIDDIKRWIIPAKSKKLLRVELASLGIRARTLYPDLYGVGLDLQSELDLGGHII